MLVNWSTIQNLENYYLTFLGESIVPSVRTSLIQRTTSVKSPTSETRYKKQYLVDNNNNC